jgi:hypothetical protein
MGMEKLLGWENVRCGVLQGCVLGPLLLKMYLFFTLTVVCFSFCITVFSGWNFEEEIGPKLTSKFCGCNSEVWQ